MIGRVWRAAMRNILRAPVAVHFGAVYAVMLVITLINHVTDTSVWYSDDTLQAFSMVWLVLLWRYVAEKSVGTPGREDE